MTRPTLAEAITIDELWKNRAGQAVKISLSTFQGRNLIDVRTWHTVDGKLKPTTKGIAAEVRHLPRLTAALAKAEAKARELGLITSDDGGRTMSAARRRLPDLLQEQSKQPEATTGELAQ